MQFTIEFQADHLIRALEAVRLEIATPQEMLGSFGESLLRANKESILNNPFHAASNGNDFVLCIPLRGSFAHRQPRR